MTLTNDLLGDSDRLRDARRRAESEFRARKTTSAMVIAGLMTVVGGVGSAEILARLNGRYVIPQEYTERVNAELHQSHWHDLLVMMAGSTLVTFGLVLLVHAAIPGRSRMEPIRGFDPYTLVGLSRVGFRRTLSDAARGVPGVRDASVRVRGGLRGRVVVRVDTACHDPGDMSEQVGAAVNARLAEINPLRTRRVVVRLSRRCG
jgi:hypothetical protein